MSFQTDGQGAYIFKDPAAIKNYKIDFSKWLTDGDIIAQAVWTVTPGIDVVRQGTLDGETSAYIVLGGGTLGKNYTVTCTITTAAELTEEKSFRVIIKNN